MTAPVDTSRSSSDVPAGGGPNAGITFPEIEAQLKAQEASLSQPKLDEVKLDGDSVPESMRGKTAREALNRITELENTLRQSEIARQQALATAQVASTRREEPVVHREEPAPEPLVTADEVAAAFSEDPAKGARLMEKMTQQQIQRASTDFMTRVAPMLSGSASALENQARTKHADAFEVYKDEIEALLKQVPDKSVMTTPQSWDDLVAFAVGRNPEKLFQHRLGKESATKKAEAEVAQRNNAGVTMSSSSRAAPAAGAPVFDETTKEVCRVLGISEQDYGIWSKVS